MSLRGPAENLKNIAHSLRTANENVVWSKTLADIMSVHPGYAPQGRYSHTSPVPLGRPDRMLNSRIAASGGTNCLFESAMNDAMAHTVYGSHKHVL